MEKSEVWLAVIGGSLCMAAGVTVHLVVHDDATFRDHDMRAEKEIDGRCKGDGQSRSIHGRDLGCTTTVMIDQQGTITI